MTDEKKKATFDIAVIGLKLLLICVAVAAVISLVFSLTAAKYEENMQEQENQAISDIFHTVSAKSEGLNAEKSVCAIIENDVKIGYCVKVVSNGFGGEMNLMVGFDTDGILKGVRITGHSETPGLGARVDNGGYLSQYVGKSGELHFKQDVDAIGGATVSSTAVLNGVNQATEILRAVLEGGVS